MSKILVTGGVRSGKSRYAEELFAADEPVRYLTPGYPADPGHDPEWAARVASHQNRRPPAWQTIETLDLAAHLNVGPVLIDCLGIWVTRRLDALEAWDRSPSEWEAQFDAELDRLVEAWVATEATVVAVTNEVGWGLVSEYPAGRVFADLLGRTNQRLGHSADEVVLMVAGKPLRIG